LHANGNPVGPTQSVNLSPGTMASLSFNPNSITQPGRQEFIPQMAPINAPGVAAACMGSAEVLSQGRALSRPTKPRRQPSAPRPPPTNRMLKKATARLLTRSRARTPVEDDPKLSTGSTSTWKFPSRRALEIIDSKNTGRMAQNSGYVFARAYRTATV
jgi:hypothetical protein